VFAGFQDSSGLRLLSLQQVVKALFLRVSKRILSKRSYTPLFFAAVSIAPRLYAWTLMPMDWNTNSYHHGHIMKTERLRARENYLLRRGAR